MVVSYSQKASLPEALSKTFDGQHPCKLCDFVKSGAGKEKKPDQQRDTTKLDPCVPMAKARAFGAGKVYPIVHTLTEGGGLIRESPPIPPPELS